MIQNDLVLSSTMCPREEGARAAEMGKEMHHCPYKARGRERSLWQLGYASVSVDIIKTQRALEREALEYELDTLPREEDEFIEAWYNEEDL